MAVGNTKGHLGRSVKSQEDQVTAKHCSNSTAVRTNRVALSAWAVCCPCCAAGERPASYTLAIPPGKRQTSTAGAEELWAFPFPPEVPFLGWLLSSRRLTRTRPLAHQPQGPRSVQRAHARAMRVAKERDVPSTQTPATDPSPTRPKAAWFFLFV